MLSTQKPVDLINEPNAYLRLQCLPERNSLCLPNALRKSWTNSYLLQWQLYSLVKVAVILEILKMVKEKQCLW